VVCQLIAAGSQRPASPTLQASLVMLAVVAVDEALLDQALALGASPDGQDIFGRVPLLEAIGRDGRLPLVWRLLAAKADLNAQDARGLTALMVTVLVDEGSYRDLDAVLLALLEAGADPNLRDQDGATALMYAMMWNHHGQARHLLAHGARLDLRDRYGNTAIAYARYGVPPDLEARLGTPCQERRGPWPGAWRPRSLGARLDVSGASASEGPERGRPRRFAEGSHTRGGVRGRGPRER
jgi:hypothetical protein